MYAKPEMRHTAHARCRILESRPACHQRRRAQDAFCRPLLHRLIDAHMAAKIIRIYDYPLQDFLTSVSHRINFFHYTAKRRCLANGRESRTKVE